MRLIFQTALFIFCVLGLSCTSSKQGPATNASEYRRIISFAPSITETLFALGVGARVVGITRFCNYPSQVKALPRIGGYLDPNYEMILSLKPDLVLLLKEHSSLIDFLQKNGIRYKIIGNESVEDIVQSVRTIGRLCGVAARADSLADSIAGELTEGEPAATERPGILVCIGRDNPGAGSIAKIFAAGPKTFYSRLLDIAGAKNIYRDSIIFYPSFSSEAVIRLSPDIIIDLMAGVANISPQKVKADWDGLTMVPAVKNGLVFCPTEDFMTIPGPRLGLILREIKSAVERYHLRITRIDGESPLKGVGGVEGDKKLHD